MPNVGVPVSISLLDHRHRIFAGRRRIARAVRQEHAVRLHRQDVFGRRGRRHDRHLAGGLREQAQDVALDAVVDRDDMKFAVGLPAVAFAELPRGLVPGEALAARHLRHEVHAFEARPLARFLLQRVEVELAVRRMRDDGVRHALLRG